MAVPPVDAGKQAQCASHFSGEVSAQLELCAVKLSDLFMWMRYLPPLQPF